RRVGDEVEVGGEHAQHVRRAVVGGAVAAQEEGRAVGADHQWRHHHRARDVGGAGALDELADGLGLPGREGGQLDDGGAGQRGAGGGEDGRGGLAVHEADDDDVGAGHGGRGVGGGLGAQRHERLGARRGPVPHDGAVAGAHERPGEGRAHGTEPEDGDVRCGSVGHAGIVHPGVRPGKYALLGAYPDAIAGRRPSTRGSHPAGAGRREHRARVRRGDPTASKERTMREVLVDFITTRDGYASGEGWPGFWGLEGPEYLAWLGEQPQVTYLMGANTYRLMSGFAAGNVPSGQDEFRPEEEASVDELTQASKVVFSSSLPEPLTWANATLIRGDAVEAVRAMKSNGSGLLSTIGSLSLCRSLLRAGLVDR